MIFQCIDCGRYEPNVANPEEHDVDPFLCRDCALERLSEAALIDGSRSGNEEGCSVEA